MLVGMQFRNIQYYYVDKPGFHLEFFRWGGSSEESLVPCPSFSRARVGRNASRSTFLRQERGTGNEAILRSLVCFGVSPHGQLCLYSHLHSVTLVACNFRGRSSSCLGGGVEHFGGEASPAPPPPPTLR